MSAQSTLKYPAQAWITTFAGTAINLCLGILYAWSIWGKALVNVDKQGQAMTGINEGWKYLTNAEAATPFSICVIVFAILMIPGGKIQDKISPKFGATLGGLLLATGCIIAGLMKSYEGLIIGFGLFGGAGMGIGYAAPTPAALKWFGQEKRGLISGLVVGGYGGAALYIGYLGQYLIDTFGITGSFVYLGIFFAIVVVVAGQMLKIPPPEYVPATNELGGLRGLHHLAVLCPYLYVHPDNPIRPSDHQQCGRNTDQGSERHLLLHGQCLAFGLLRRPRQRMRPSGNRVLFR